MATAAKIEGMIAIIVVMIVALACTPIIVNQVQSTMKAATAPATEWNFTGSDGALALLGLVPFLWVAMILVMDAVGMFALAKSDV